MKIFLKLFNYTILFILLSHNVTYAFSGNDEKLDTWPKFGLVFQDVKDINKASNRYLFYWGSRRLASQLEGKNQDGIYLAYFNLFKTNESLSKNGISPDMDYIMTNHPEWLMRYKDGSLIFFGSVRGIRLDIGNPAYVDYALSWLQKQLARTDVPIKNIGLDNGMFAYADKRWAQYDTNEAYRAAWEYFLRRLSQSLRPRHKIVLNVGSSDLATFSRMIRWVDGVLYEDLCYAPHRPGFDLKKASQEILDRWRKGRWCMENGKIWAVRYLTTSQALQISTNQEAAISGLSVSDQEILLLDDSSKILHRINLSDPSADNLAKLAHKLEQCGLQVSLLNPYPEAATVAALEPQSYLKIGSGTVLRFKQPPKEAFIFGYAAVLMVAGPNSYFILGDEKHQEYYYPEMDQPLGRPLAPMTEVAPQIYRRNFEEALVYLNLSSKPYQVSSDQVLPPWRGVILRP